MIQFVAKLLPLSNSVSFFVVALVLGPILGSFITEPAGSVMKDPRMGPSTSATTKKETLLDSGRSFATN